MNPDIYDYMSKEDAQEHRRLTQLLELARSSQPLTVTQLAQLCGCSEATIYATQQDALNKLKNKHPELKQHLTK